MQENKSVIDHLNSIENDLANDKKPKTISEAIGEPFLDYFNSSTIYLYESDERKFNREKKKKLRFAIITLMLCILPLIADVAIAIYAQEMIWLNFLGDLLILCFPILCIVYYAKMKTKKLADSKHNLLNIKFYVADGRLCQETSKGLISILALILAIFSFIGFIALTIVQYIFLPNSDIKGIFLTIDIISIILLFYLFIDLKVRLRDNFYSAFVFEKEESYVICQYGEWKKVNKTDTSN